jgi:hypothetical protein
MMKALLIVALAMLLDPVGCGDRASGGKRAPGSTPTPVVSSTQIGNAADSSAPTYRLLTKRDCLKKENCLAMFYIAKDDLTDANLVNLIRKLKTKVRGRLDLVAFFFDDEKLGESAASGAINPIELERYARGVYRIDKSDEYLKIKKTPPDGSDPWRSVPLN